MADWTKDQLISGLDQANHRYVETRHDRTAWMLHAHQHGLAYHEIADVLGITESGARKAIQRAVDI